MSDSQHGTVIFDLDGTLVDSAPDLADALDNLLAERGHAPLGLLHVRRLIGHGVAELVRKGLLARGEAAEPAVLAKATQRFLHHYTANLSRRSRPYPGAAEVLGLLRQDGWRLVVCTNKVETSARKLLADLGLLPAFALVAGPDTFGVAKPDPGHLLRCVPAGGPQSFPAIMIGDSEVDVAAAKAAGVPVVAVTWGYAQGPLDVLSPDAIAGQMHDIPVLVRRLAAGK